MSKIGTKILKVILPNWYQNIFILFAFFEFFYSTTFTFIDTEKTVKN